MKIDMINKKGVRVRVNSKHAKVLAKIGVLTYPPVEEVKAPPLSLPKKGTYANRAMVAETPATRTWPQTSAFEKDVDGKA